MKSTVLHEASIDEQKEHATIRVTKLISIPAEAESGLVLVTSVSGPMTIARMHTRKLTQRNLSARVMNESRKMGCPLIYVQYRISSYL